jgi:hypothetical protein
MIVVAVAPYYSLQNAAYSVTPGLGYFTAKAPSGNEDQWGPGSAAAPVTDVLSGGKWMQGAGLLFIRAPGRVPDFCSRGKVAAKASAALLASYGIYPGKAFDPSGLSYEYVRTSAPPPGR